MNVISIKPIDDELESALRAAAQDAIHFLDVAGCSPIEIVAAIDEWIFSIQSGTSLEDANIDESDAVVAMGSCWGFQLIDEFGWRWLAVELELDDGSYAKVLAVASENNELAIYPESFVHACLEDPDLDCTILLAFNMLKGKMISDALPNELMNVMKGVHRIIPRK